jgi:hypothetical protein
VLFVPIGGAQTTRLDSTQLSRVFLWKTVQIHESYSFFPGPTTVEVSKKHEAKEPVLVPAHGARATRAVPAARRLWPTGH